MKQSAKKQISASTLRIILSISILVVIAVTIAAFSFSYQKLMGYAADISKKKIDAATSDNTIKSLKQAEIQLNNNSDVVKKIDSLYSKDRYPEFVIVEEVQAIAKRNGIVVTDFAYGSSTENSGSAAGAATQPQPSSGMSQAPATTSTPQAPSSETFSLTVTINSFKKSKYKNFLQFLSDIEQNLPKLKVKDVSVSSGQSSTTQDSNSPSQESSSSSSSDSISVSPIVIDMYIKKGQQ